MTDSHSKFLVVGAGPVGLVTALMLARNGFATTVLDRHASPLAVPKAHVLNSRSLEILRAMGIDVTHLRGLGPALEDSRLVRFTASLAGRQYGAEPFERQDASVLEVSPEPLANIAQPIFEAALAELVANEPLITLRRGHTWTGLAERADGYRSTVVGPEGGYNIDSTYVLGCDGAASAVRSALGIAMEGDAQVQTCLTVHFRANLREIVADRPALMYWAINPEINGCLVAYDIDSNWVFVRFDGPGQQGERFPSNEAAEAAIRKAIGDDQVAIEVLSQVPWVMTSQVAERYRASGVYLIGDAAHRFPPSGGLGLNTGIQDAHNLVWKLTAVEHSWADRDLLDTYESERRAIARANADQSLSNALTAPRLIEAMIRAGTYSDDELPAELMTEVQQAMAANSVTFDNFGLHLGFSYDPAKPLPPTPDVFVPRAHPGDRMPHGWIGDPADGLSTIDLVSPGAFTVFARNATPEFGTAMRTAAGGVPLKIVDTDEYSMPVPWLQLTLGSGSAGAMLVRPDGHILATTRGADAAAAAGLSEQLGTFVHRRTHALIGASNAAAPKEAHAVHPSL